MTVAAIRHEVDGNRLYFECPGCGELHAPFVTGDRKAHPVWNWNSLTDRPTLHPSVRVTWKFGSAKEPRICHFHVVDGYIQFLGDSTHKLSGKTVQMTEWPHETHTQVTNL